MNAGREFIITGERREKCLVGVSHVRRLISPRDNEAELCTVHCVQLYCVITFNLQQIMKIKLIFMAAINPSYPRLKHSSLSIMNY